MGLLPTNLTAGQSGHISHSNQAYGKLNSQWVDVQADYEATGDGSTEDTTAVQAAIDAVNTAGGGTGFFPKGTYVVNGLTIPGNNIVLLGAGWSSILKHKAATADNTYVVSVNPGTGGTSDPTQNITGLIIRDLQ